MKHIIKNITLWSAAGLMLFSSCKKEERGNDTQLPAGEYPISLAGENSGVLDMTTKTPGDPEFGVYIDDVEKPITKSIYDNEIFTAEDVSGGALGSLEIADDENQKYWETINQRLNIYAYYPYSADGLTELSVKADQGNYFNHFWYSNFSKLYAKLENQYFEDRKNLVLPFKHIMSGALIYLKAGDGVEESELNDAEVRILGTYTQADFDIRTGQATNHSDQQDITPYKNIDQAYQAMLVPHQEVSRMTDFVTVELNGVKFYAPLGGEGLTTTLESGKVYRMIVTVYRDRIEMTYTLKDWEAADFDATDANEEKAGAATLGTDYPNCYHMVYGNSNYVEIPVMKAYRMWETEPSFVKHLKDNNQDLRGELTAEILWQDHGYEWLDVEVIEGVRGKDSKIKVTQNGVTIGNAVVAVRIGGVIRWTYHIWVTDDDPFTTTYTYNNGFVTNTFMDRNLGADYSLPGFSYSIGLTYQAGRKDPFPFVRDWDGDPMGMFDKDGNPLSGLDRGLIISTTIPTLAAMATNPHVFINNTNGVFKSDGDSEKESWANFSSKSVYDPCPKGWRVPQLTRDHTGKLISPLQGVAKPDPAKIHKGWITDGLVYYPATGLRNRDGGIVSVGSQGFYGLALNKMACFGIGGDNMELYPVDAEAATPIRCVKEMVD